LPRSEVERVDKLRTEWKKLSELVDEVCMFVHACLYICTGLFGFFFQVRHSLLVTQRFIFEQEVDKNAKALMVDSIQFRNNFDTEGPLMPGLSCFDAVQRLGKNTIHAVHISLKITIV